MGSIVTVHSYRGGTGKSNLSANLAAALAMTGKRVGVVDTDIQSPGLHVIFGVKSEDLPANVNDYLAGKLSIEQCAHDTSESLKLPKGKVFLVPASLKYLEIAKILKNGFDLQRMVEGLRNVLDKLSLDVLVVDTHPGLGEETMLYTVMSRLLLILLRTDQQDYLGTGVLVGVAKKLSVPNIGLVVNKLLPEYHRDDVMREVSARYDCPVLETLPFDKDVMMNESARPMVVDRPEHPWSQAVTRLARQVLERIERPAGAA